jgi:hypothetical protein
MIHEKEQYGYYGMCAHGKLSNLNYSTKEIKHVTNNDQMVV